MVQFHGFGIVEGSEEIKKGKLTSALALDTWSKLFLL